MMDGLRPEILRPERLSEEEKLEMLVLLRLQFEGIASENFRRDLAQKDWVFLLRDSSLRIKGFTTAQFIHASIGNNPVTAVFSGDTVKHMDHFGRDHFASFWIGFMLEQRKLLDRPLYWFLISSGFRTYKFLPAFARNYYPSPETAGTEGLKEILDLVADRKFGRDYDASTGLVRFSHSRERLRTEVSPATEEALRCQHTRFYLERNPRHAEGVELACLTELAMENLRPMGVRLARDWDRNLLHGDLSGDRAPTRSAA